MVPVVSLAPQMKGSCYPELPMRLHLYSTLPSLLLDGSDMTQEIPYLNIVGYPRQHIGRYIASCIAPSVVVNYRFGKMWEPD